MSRAEWSPDGKELPEVELHTKAKHRILEEYVENLIVTLYGKKRYGVRNFVFVDAFCGGGMYRDPETGGLWEGSPLRIIKAVQRGYKKSRRQYSLNVQYIFMDSQKAHLDCLKNYSFPQAGLESIAASEACIFEHGEFESRIDWLIFTVGLQKGHSLFLLDPFGWTQVSMESIRKINSLPGSEIIYTYMIDFIARFIEQRDDNQFSNFQNILEADGYYVNANPVNLATVGEQCYLRNESMRLFRERGNARYVFTFALIPRGRYRVLYYLMHMSRNLTALEVVKESFWKENTLDYEYYFELYGYGFRSADYYQEEQLELRFDIGINSDGFCIEKLDRDVGKLVEESIDGIAFREISEQTMERNPASKKHYTQYLNERKAASEIEVIRKGERLPGNRIIFQKGDIIRPTRYSQLFFFKI